MSLRNLFEDIVNNSKNAGSGEDGLVTYFRELYDRISSQDLRILENSEPGFFRTLLSVFKLKGEAAENNLEVDNYLSEDVERPDDMVNAYRKHEADDTESWVNNK